MPTYKFIYFNGKGGGELARLIFAAAGKQYEDFRIEFKDWPNYKSKMPFQQIPVLEITDGSSVTQLAQSIAIARYLANEFGLAGKSPLEKAKVDMIADQYLDLQRAVAQTVFEKDETKKAELNKKYYEETLPQSFQYFEDILKSNNTGYFVGNDLTWADLFAIRLLDCSNGKADSILDKYPSLKQHAQRIRGLPKVAEWLAKRPVTEM